MPIMIPPTVPAYPADRFAPLADRLASLMRTENDLVFVQGEAILALEAAATSLARPGLVALNLVSSPYGALFGRWLERGGASVRTVAAGLGQPLDIESVGEALDAMAQCDLVSLVHAETSTGILNPLPGIAALAREKGALIVVDAVASFGGEEFAVDDWGIDVAVAGPQKAIGGPAGLSMVTVGERAWRAIAEAGRADAPASSLSLGDIKTAWLDRGRGALPGMPSAHEFWALDAAVEAVEKEGLGARIARHGAAAAATRRGLIAMGLATVAIDERCSSLATVTPVPDAVDAHALVEAARRMGAAVNPGLGDLEGKIVRLDHMGERADLKGVTADLVGYGAALRMLGHPVDLGAGIDAVATYFDKP